MDVSVIIPTRDRPRYLKSLLASVAGLDFPRESYEILVVDNGSDRDTRQVAEQFGSANSAPRVRYMSEPVPGQLAGRHRGAKEAEGELLVFTDDDIEVGQNWLLAIVEAFRDPSVHLVGGRSLPRYETPPPEWIQSFWHVCKYSSQMRDCEFLSLLDLGEHALAINPWLVWGLNYSIRKQTLFELGGFHPDVMPEHLLRYTGNGEIGLSLKAAQKGLKAVYQPGALVYHVVPSGRLTVEYFEKRAFTQGVKISYADIRAGQGEAGSDGSAVPSGLRRFAHYMKGKFRPGQDDRIHLRVANAHTAGYRFHQRQVRTDPALLEWVLKEDYWDYRPPGYDAGRGSPRA